MFSEITQKNKLEILGKLSANLSHELRNPLSAIKLNLDYMKMSSEELSEDLIESLNSCIIGVNRIEYLIENILSFSRKSRNNNMLVSINEVSETAVNLTSAKASKERIVIKSEYLETLPKIEFSESNLLQVFLNLLTNAIEACSDRNGEITIKSYFKEPISDGKIIWEITDNGVGINDENKEKIFSEFFTNKATGTGIGLSVCHAILEEKGAVLKFESELGKGTSFYIIFQIDPEKNNVE